MVGNLCDVDGLRLPPGTRKCHVAVTPEGIQPQITVPTSYLTNEKLDDMEVDEFITIRSTGTDFSGVRES